MAVTQTNSSEVCDVALVAAAQDALARSFNTSSEPNRNGHKQRWTAEDDALCHTPTATESSHHVSVPLASVAVRTKAAMQSAVSTTAKMPATRMVDANPSSVDLNNPSELTEETSISDDAQTNDKCLAVKLTPEVIADFAREANVQCFQDQHGNVFAWIPVEREGKKHFETLGIKSRRFLAQLLQLIKSRTTTMPKLATLRQAIELLQLEAYRVPRMKLDNRRATVGNDVFIDLGDNSWRMIRANRDGWNVEEQDEPRFFRPQHMQSLPEPERGGDLDALFTYIPAETDSEKLLLTAWLLGSMHPAIPNPILLLVGQQGSAKTTRSRRLRSLLDPSVTPVMGDLEMADLFLTFQHHAVPCFENVSKFNRREADMFCRAVTGNGVERRKLYTDGDQVLYSFRRPIIINGIDTPSTRPDFLDRCVIYNCRRMDEFIPLEDLDRQFESDRPRLFGAMLDLLVRTLKAVSTTLPAKEFRMADFAKFGRAVAIALGKSPTEFDYAYRMNIQQQSSEVLEDAPMGRLLQKFAIKSASTKPWIGTAEDLLKKLKDFVHKSGREEDYEDLKGLPKSARWLSSRLGELAPALATRLVYIQRLPRTNAARNWQISTSVQPDPHTEPDDILDVLLGPEEENRL